MTERLVAVFTDLQSVEGLYNLSQIIPQKRNLQLSVVLILCPVKKKVIGQKKYKVDLEGASGMNFHCGKMENISIVLKDVMVHT